jgi:hypothetical protein
MDDRSNITSKAKFHGYTLMTYREETPSDLSISRAWRFGVVDHSGNPVSAPLSTASCVSRSEAEEYARRVARDHGNAVGDEIAADDLPQWERTSNFA